MGQLSEKDLEQTEDDDDGVSGQQGILLFSTFSNETQIQGTTPNYNNPTAQ